MSQNRTLLLLFANFFPEDYLKSGKASNLSNAHLVLDARNQEALES